MSVYEMRALLEHSDLCSRDSWEQSRMLAFTMARCAGAKVKDVTEVFALPWDKEKEETEAPKAEDMKRLRDTARWLSESGALRIENSSALS